MELRKLGKSKLQITHQMKKISSVAFLVFLILNDKVWFSYNFIVSILQCNI